MSRECEALVVGSGPNGLTAAIRLARAGVRTLVVELDQTIGGGARTSELTLPGFRHDVCSAVHPTAYLSPAFREIGLEDFGLEWIFPAVSAAHPLDGESPVLLYPSARDTAKHLGKDDRNYLRLVQPLMPEAEKLIGQLLDPFALKKDLFNQARFGARGLPPAKWVAKALFKDARARALWAGCAAHSILPFDFWGTSAVALVFLLAGHLAPWPVALGGSSSIAAALERAFREAGGEIRLGQKIERFDQLPKASRYLFDLDPKQLASICGNRLGNRYRKALSRYQYGPGVCKLDFALSQAIPWRDRDCLLASTVHVGGDYEEVAASERAAWDGVYCDKPFVMVCQQSQFDPSRAPSGHHTGYAYCHVPAGSARSMAPEMTRQIERFAPGFSDCVLATNETTASGFEAYNPAYVGGAISGGAAKLTQLFTRPVAKLDPYRTSNPNLFLCSQSTPPGGGVHGMCGWSAARSVLRSLKRQG
ncbi:NAD(P)/FAD-dependent oxidoreductase [Pelagicoccus sp. SDUM812002]|uniref:phytoene desaturase family protein n=1 Tax=Pelagicoccus sp. SDUM812002 TaxID=3041266 RepID=UPI00280D3DFF|nr:NAD(P)/FAD-dependent oxidoreductase [Pelagicoccus sp. SDUM812002]MDQ8185160.1 NAD(P)/FAD-dependent oxidoreductase [Pelagicoccus sp. SDUM812002]